MERTLLTCGAAEIVDFFGDVECEDTTCRRKGQRCKYELEVDDDSLM